MYNRSVYVMENVMPGLRELAGTKMGAWNVERLLGRNKNNHLTYWCRCECGTEREVVAQALKERKTVSCGCQKSSLIAKANTKTGRAGSRAHTTWYDMVRRCTNPDMPNWRSYGSRGIKVCDEWLVFENWNRDMGDPPPALAWSGSTMTAITKSRTAGGPQSKSRTTII